MRALAAIANHLLRGDAWAQAQLGEHAGKSLRLTVPPFAVALRITAGGEFEALAESPPAFDLDLTVSPGALPLVLLGRSAGADTTDIRGDADLAKALYALADAAPWFLERELARRVGPIAAQRLVELARSLAAWPAYAAEHVGGNIAAYLVEEQPMLVKGAQLHEFADGVARVHDAVARLEKRIDQIADSVAAKLGRGV